MPGTAHNKNALAHGRSSYLATGRLPKGCSYIGRMMSKLRKQITDAVADKFGGVSLTQAATIQSAIRHEVSCLLVSRYEAQHADALSTDQWIALRRLLSTETTKRDAALKSLGLDLAERSKLAGMSGYVTLDAHAEHADDDESDTHPGEHTPDDATSTQEGKEPA
jgi:hypothetical protein